MLDLHIPSKCYAIKGQCVQITGTGKYILCIIPQNFQKKIIQSDINRWLEIELLSRVNLIPGTLRFGRSVHTTLTRHVHEECIMPESVILLLTTTLLRLVAIPFVEDIMGGYVHLHFECTCGEVSNTCKL